MNHFCYGLVRLQTAGRATIEAVFYIMIHDQTAPSKQNARPPAYASWPLSLGGILYYRLGVNKRAIIMHYKYNHPSTHVYLDNGMVHSSYPVTKVRLGLNSFIFIG